ncbi:MAG: polysaccharide deacetylase family protein [Mycobacteriales bacterium]
MSGGRGRPDEPGDPSRRAFLAALAALATSAACGSTRPSAKPPSTPAGSSTPPQPTHPPASARPITGPAREVDSGSRSRPVVALTFHGQGDPALAADLLSEDERVGARLTVFAVGSWLAAQPDMAHRIRTGGHELANHTQNHRPMAAMAESEAYQEFTGCAQVLRRLAGSTGNWVRPSGTPHTTSALRAAAGRAGYRVCVGYDVDSLDYTDPTADVVRQRVRAARPGSIVSMHLGHRVTVSALPSILTDLNDRGLRSVTVTELLGRP